MNCVLYTVYSTALEAIFSKEGGGEESPSFSLDLGAYRKWKVPSAWPNPDPGTHDKPVSLSSSRQ